MKQTVFLFGAGSSLPWGAPSTNDLTQLITKSGFKIKGEGDYITNFIYNKLLQSVDNVNFETILNVIEELIIFYTDEQKGAFFYSPFFDSEDLDKMLNFSIIGGVEQHGYVLQNPEEYKFFKPSYFNEKPSQFFFQHLFSELLSTICGAISNYSYRTTSYSVINPNSGVSQQFGKWITDKAKDSVIRMYTLNYDCLFKELMQNNGIDVFDGFDNSHEIQPGNEAHANINRIYSDVESHIYYNLHGSIFWRVFSNDFNQAEVLHVGTVDIPCNDYSCITQIEKGKTFPVSNIVSGYHKAHRVILSPLRHMYASFDRDCCMADSIFICGYSFGDAHINECIRTALRYNENVKIEIVDPYFDKELLLMTKFFPRYNDFERTALSQKMNNMILNSDGSYVVYKTKFEDFLKENSERDY